jgi:hypothetical protein
MLWRQTGGGGEGAGLDGCFYILVLIPEFLLSFLFLLVMS